MIKKLSRIIQHSPRYPISQFQNFYFFSSFIHRYYEQFHGGDNISRKRLSSIYIQPKSQFKNQREKKKQLMGFIANNLLSCNQKLFDSLDCSEHLQNEYQFISKILSSSTTYDKFQEKYNTM